MPSTSGSAPRDNESNKTVGSPLTKYFLVVLFGFSVVSLLINSKFVQTIHLREESNAIGSTLKDFHANSKEQMLIKKLKEKISKTEEKVVTGTATDPPLEGDDDDDNQEEEEEEEEEGGDGEQEGDDGDEEVTKQQYGDDGFNSLDEPENEGGNGDNGNGDNGNVDNGNGDNGGDGNNGDTNDGNGGGDNDHSDNTEGDDDDSPPWEENKNDDETEHDKVIDKFNKGHTIANLKCDAHGGPSNKDAEEMVYWEDIPKDAQHISPFHADYPKNKGKDGVQPITQFLTFEPDAGGWNNIRMAMETVFTLAFAMGRTLVLPPKQGMYLIDKNSKQQRNKFGFDHFFHTESISNEHIGLNIITTTEFLELCAKGEIVDADGKPIYPPNMRTDFDDAPFAEQKQLRDWMRANAGQNLVEWNPDRCVAAFPASNSEQDTKDLESLPEQILKENGKFPTYHEYIGSPNAIDAPPIERLKELSAGRTELCTYTPDLQQKQWIHFPVGMQGSRLLVHFYAFLFFQDWKQDLWMKRFVRDHVRYIDHIQCAAARVVTAVRKRTSDRTEGASTDFDTIHVRRGDFQFKEVWVEAETILDQLKKVLTDPTTTLYIATDERDKSWFKPIVDHYADVVFLDDMLSEVEGINTNYYGMVDQLVASRGKNFFGCWFSTFTGYINRLRGYHTDDQKLPGYENGETPSYFYAPSDRFGHMREYWPVKQQFYAREFPTAWRLIDTSI